VRRGGSSRWVALLAGLLASGLFACTTTAPSPERRVPADRASPAVFRIQVVDSETGRGIPAVELSASNGRSWFTDSAGTVAILDPGLMKQKVFFQIRSFGYAYDAQEQGVTGTWLKVLPRRSARLEMRRENVAERLYRITGIQPYRDTVLAGEKPPFQRRPQAQLPTGMDSVLMTLHRGKLFWVWGDTRQLALPFGIFRATAATSLPPDRPGVDPERGIDLRYFTGPHGLRPMVDDPHPVVWLSALRSVPDGSGQKKLYATYRKIVSPMATSEMGLAEYDDRARSFRLIAAYPPETPMVPDGHVLRYRENGVDYLQYDWDVRSQDVAEAVRDLARYEAYTPTRPGAALGEGAAALERNDDGALVWGWKRNAPRVPYKTWQGLEQSGAISAAERPFRLIDVEDGEPIEPHAGSTRWNEFRRRWIMIRGQRGGPVSQLGEIYYFEGDTPLGPWAYGRKILTHGRPVQLPLQPNARETYSFYNPVQHPEFDRAGGREIFFEGTLTLVFANPKAPRIPDYDYNQMMYKLQLDDPRLVLPVPVYRHGAKYGTREHFEEANSSARGPTWLPAEIAFFAPDRPRPDTQPVRTTGEQRLTLDPEAPPGSALFHCATSATPPPATIPLYEHADAEGSFAYTTEARDGSDVLCHVWPAPADFNASLPRAATPQSSVP
jgi:hypothetical protein